jgi:H+/gluconate symporter-like permease
MPILLFVIVLAAILWLTIPDAKVHTFLTWVLVIALVLFLFQEQCQTNHR